jgi:hypothetical protein
MGQLMSGLAGDFIISGFSFSLLVGRLVDDTFDKEGKPFHSALYGEGEAKIRFDYYVVLIYNYLRRI